MLSPSVHLGRRIPFIQISFGRVAKQFFHATPVQSFPSTMSLARGGTITRNRALQPVVRDSPHRVAESPCELLWSGVILLCTPDAETFATRIFLLANTGSRTNC